MPLPSAVDVVVVGAGPTGLAAACALQQRGVQTLVLDAAVEPSTASRATVVHSRTLECLDEFSLTESFLRKGDILTDWMVFAKDWNILHLDFAQLNAKYPIVVTIPQTDTETLLREKLETLGGSVQRGIQVQKVVQGSIDVELSITSVDPHI